VYTLNTCSLDQPASEQVCRSAGGHLVSYESLEEQQEVEQYYIDKVSSPFGAVCTGAPWLNRQKGCWAAGCTHGFAVGMHFCCSHSNVAHRRTPTTVFSLQGFLMPSFHGRYWIGLNATRPQSFYWLQPGLSAPSPQTYAHWGRNLPTGPSEPNNLERNELCGAANFSQGYMKAAGWQDTRCNYTAPSICKMQRERQCLANCFWRVVVVAFLMPHDDIPSCACPSELHLVLLLLQPRCRRATSPRTMRPSA
jgi:hypothetical protein